MLGEVAALGRRRYGRGARGLAGTRRGQRDTDRALSPSPGTGTPRSRSVEPLLGAVTRPGAALAQQGGVTLLSHGLLLSGSFRDRRSQGNVFLPGNP